MGASMAILLPPLMNAISSASRAKISEFGVQGLANPAWAVALLDIEYDPLLDAISAESLLKISEFDGQECANTAFAFATLHSRDHMPLLGAIVVQSIDICRDIQEQS